MCHACCSAKIIFYHYNMKLIICKEFILCSFEKAPAETLSQVHTFAKVNMKNFDWNLENMTKAPRKGAFHGAPRATAFEPNGKGIAISFHKWSCGRCRGKTIQAEKLRAQLQCSRSGRQVCQKAVMRKRAAEKAVALFRCPTHPVPPDRLKRRCFFVIVYRY